MKEEESIYRAFSNLSEFIKEKKILIKENKNGGNVEFSEAMQNVKKIPQDAERIRKQSRSTPRTTHILDSKKQLEESLQDYQNLNVTNLPEYMEGYADGINPLTMEKLKNGEFSIEKTLDLHGYSIDNAEKIFSQFLKEAICSGFHCIKVIHGRGLKSKGKPLLKERLKTWIVKAMHRKWIIAFSSAKMCDGGPGATCILLKHKPEKKRIHIIG